jgi:hypothetical protein
VPEAAARVAAAVRNRLKLAELVAAELRELVAHHRSSKRRLD